MQYMDLDTHPDSGFFMTQNNFSNFLQIFSTTNPVYFISVLMMKNSTEMKKLEITSNIFEKR